MSETKLHVVPTKDYALVFGALMFLTVATVIAANFDFGVLNDVIALGIAVTKATLVILIFMNVRNATKLTPMVIGGGILFFVIFVAMTLSDYMTRAWMGVPGR